MGNEMVPVVPKELTDLNKVDKKGFDLVTTGGGYLPRIQLMGTGSDLVVKSQVKAGSYCEILDQKWVDLGNEVDALLLGWRTKAMELGEQVVSAFDVESA